MLVHVNLGAYSCYNIQIARQFIQASLEQVVTNEIVIKEGCQTKLKKHPSFFQHQEFLGNTSAVAMTHSYLLNKFL